MSKKRRNRRSKGPRHRPVRAANDTAPPPPPPPRADADELVRQLVEAITARRFAETSSPLAALATDPARAVPALQRVLDAAVRALWLRGWQPADVPRAVSRQMSSGGVALVRGAILSESVSYSWPGAFVPEDWASQLDAVRRQPHEVLNAERLRAVVFLLDTLWHLPALPRLMPPPHEWRAGRQQTAPSSKQAPAEKVLVRIRALLAKAESTTFPAEAEALTAKAQELMARYSIDTALLDRDNFDPTAPDGTRIRVENPYAPAKSLLLSLVAEANRCSAVDSGEYRFSDVFGFRRDLELVELLYTSLLIQADVALAAAGRQRDEFGRSRTRAFRSSFLGSFAIRIGERLREAASAGFDAAVEEHGARLLPVLANRSAAVEDARDAAYPHTTTKRSISISDADGWHAGRRAASLANLAPGAPLKAPSS